MIIKRFNKEKRYNENIKFKFFIKIKFLILNNNLYGKTYKDINNIQIKLLIVILLYKLKIKLNYLKILK